MSDGAHTSMTRTATNSLITLSTESGYLIDTIANQRVVEALEHGRSLYACQRTMRFAVRMNLNDALERFRKMPGYACTAYSVTQLWLQDPTTILRVSITSKNQYISLHIGIQCASYQQALEIEGSIKQLFTGLVIHDPAFSVEWWFATGKQKSCANVEEVNTDVLLDEAYPSLNGVDRFIKSYLDSEESVLILQGPPGTGKTRLVRRILSQLSMRKPETPASVLYTGDRLALNGEELYVHYVTGGYDAFVIEDIDSLLKPRTNGNEGMHSLLTAADGIVRSPMRKMIFTTNLPNIGDVDEALTRRGRCFGQYKLELLSPSQANRLYAALKPGAPVGENLFHKSMSLADVYARAKQQ